MELQAFVHWGEGGKPNRGGRMGGAETIRIPFRRSTIPPYYSGGGVERHAELAGSPDRRGLSASVHLAERARKSPLKCENTGVANSFEMGDNLRRSARDALSRAVRYDTSPRTTSDCRDIHPPKHRVSGRNDSSRDGDERWGTCYRLRLFCLPQHGSSQ